MARHLGIQPLTAEQIGVASTGWRAETPLWFSRQRIRQERCRSPLWVKSGLMQCSKPCPLRANSGPYVRIEHFSRRNGLASFTLHKIEQPLGTKH